MTKRQGYRVRVGEREHEVEVELDSDGNERILVDGEAFEVAAAGGQAVRVSPADPARTQQLELSVAGSPRPTEAWLAGTRVAVELRTEQEARLAAALGKGAAGSGSGELRAPMPGRVVKILVSLGEEVELGAPVVIVEAMKMENELQAPVTGSVRQILVSEGDTVDAGQPLVELVAPELEADAESE